MLFELGAVFGLGCLSTLVEAGVPAPVIRPYKPALRRDFPDPSIIQGPDNMFYAFATTGGDKVVQVQAARASSPTGPWQQLADTNVLPNPGPAFTGQNTWAPDVQRLDDGSYVLYFSGQLASNPDHHCVGAATSRSILGPYVPQQQPFACDVGVGGQIDPSGFRDADGKRYVVYKVDGNSLGNGGQCKNGIAPRRATPIELQEVGPNGIDKIGPPIQILDRIGDEPLVEAPDLYRAPDGTYILFFSSGCFTDPSYNVHYATSRSVRGPFTRAARPLLVSNDVRGLVAPGGASVLAGGENLVFHANCDVGRCMYQKRYRFRDGSIRLMLS
ncbi:glycoside hydrolase family 43 protein [Ophiocordyceps camponoti-floridani]|uniref:Glycoside hydrolase family 43 protein n=1 Tax=Ophiocordyceps camponoti-floridani TaxID=2030778 RepID=A0A8H4VEN1_9HYPO|nr:glycoside hydrolase family 43 protein [Ophiocordyceps camponoti-floridani]